MNQISNTTSEETHRNSKYSVDIPTDAIHKKVCRGRIVEMFWLDGPKEEPVLKHEFMCEYCRDPILPNANNGLKTFHKRSAVKRFLLSKRYLIESIVCRDVGEDEVSVNAEYKKPRSFSKGETVYVFENSKKDNKISIAVWDKDFVRLYFYLPLDAILPLEPK
jgi:hypothetical protein